MHVHRPIQSEPQHDKKKKKKKKERNIGSLASYSTHSEDSKQTRQMRMLIRVISVHTLYISFCCSIVFFIIWRAATYKSRIEEFNGRIRVLQTLN